MVLLRGLFPSFEKPVERQRYLNIEPQRRDFRGIGAVLGLAAFCGVALAVWEPSQPAQAPLAAVASVTRPAPVQAGKPAGSETETTASAEAEDEQPTPTVKLSALCAQRPSARRGCAEVKAVKEARLKAPAPAAAKAAGSAIAANAQADAADAPPPQRTAAAPKAKRPRLPDDAPVERLVRVYDQVLPDGRRVPVYRRASGGGFETGSIVDGEYRPARRANLEPPASPRYFGLQ